MRAYVAGLVFMMSAVGALAQDPSAAKKTVIDLNYDSVMDRAHPNPVSDASVHFHIQVELSGGNRISMVHDLLSGRLTDERSTEQALGEGARSGVWHVLSKNRLVHIWNMAQSIRTVTVTLTPQNTCTLEVKDQLKPGVHEYAFAARWSNGLEYYSRYENINMSCTIH